MTGLFGGILTAWLTGISAAEGYGLKAIIVPETGVSPITIEQVLIWQVDDGSEGHGDWAGTSPLLGDPEATTTQLEDPFSNPSLISHALTKADAQDFWYSGAFDFKDAVIGAVSVGLLGGRMDFGPSRVERTVECSPDDTRWQVIKVQYNCQDVFHSIVLADDDEEGEDEGEEGDDDEGESMSTSTSMSTRMSTSTSED